MPVGLQNMWKFEKDKLSKTDQYDWSRLLKALIFYLLE